MQTEQIKPQRQKHNYTSELELKSLLIRIKNRKIKKEYPETYNSNINKYIKTFVRLTNKKYPKDSYLIKKKNNLRKKIKLLIVKQSEVTNIDTPSHERFGEVILLMIKSILTKPNFSGYTYKTDFYSDAIHKILRYLHNFDHTMISKRSGTFVNAFAYISQIIHNSVIYIINTKKKEQINIDKQVSNEIIDHNLNIMNHHNNNINNIDIEYEFKKVKSKEYHLSVTDNIIPSIKEILEDTKQKEIPIIYYPNTYHMTMDEYNELKPLLKYASIVRYKGTKDD